MKTLVYFASGLYKEEYQNLDFDNIFLVDNYFKNSKIFPNNIFTIGKVHCIGMDCLDAINYLKDLDIKIDYLVQLNEGLQEGGGCYPLNSDFFIGYLMPLLKDNYIHIYSKNYRENGYYPKMNIPFDMREMDENEEGYIKPQTFTHYTKYAKVFQMKRIFNSKTLLFNPNVKVSIHHDSIWNWHNELNLLAISISQPWDRCRRERTNEYEIREGKKADPYSLHNVFPGFGFFDQTPKTFSIKLNTIDMLFDYCGYLCIEKVGIIPWANGNYRPFIEFLKNFNSDYPKEIHLFHLNKNDFKLIKEAVPQEEYMP